MTPPGGTTRAAKTPITYQTIIQTVIANTQRSISSFDAEDETAFNEFAQTSCINLDQVLFTSKGSRTSDGLQHYTGTLDGISVHIYAGTALQESTNIPKGAQVIKIDLNGNGTIEESSVYTHEDNIGLGEIASDKTPSSLLKPKCHTHKSPQNAPPEDDSTPLEEDDKPSGPLVS